MEGLPGLQNEFKSSLGNLGECLQKYKEGPGEMVQWVEGLRGKHEDLNLDPQQRCKKQSMVVCTGNGAWWSAVMGGRDNRIPVPF